MVSLGDVDLLEHGREVPEEHVHVPPLAQGTDHARLFLYAEGPPGFAMKNNRFESGKSFVLYVADIFKP